MIKKIMIALFLVLFTSFLLFSGSSHAENGAGIIIATGRDVPTDDHLQEEYRFPEKYRDNAVQFKTEDGVLLCGYVLGEGSRGITLGHPNGWMVKSWLPFGERLAEAGYQVILWEFRGNLPSGSAEGDAARRWDLDVLAAAQVLRERGAAELLCLGASDGGTASAIAAPCIPELVGLGLLSSPKDSVGDAISAIGSINDVPAFFAVATNDFAGDFYPHVKALYEACPSTQKVFYEIDGFDHGTDLINPEVPGLGYAAFPDTEEQKQVRKELADELMRFVEIAFDQDRNAKDSSAMPASPSGDEEDGTETPALPPYSEYTENASDRSGDSDKGHLRMFGLGTLGLLMIAFAVIKAKRRK